MGSWYGTCGITQFPIRWEEKVKLVFLAKTIGDLDHLGGGFCKPTDLWTPIMFPITGFYDDGGGIEEIEGDENTEMIVKYFNGKGYDKTDNFILDKECHTKLDTIENIVNAVERGYVTMHPPYGQNRTPLKVSFMLIKDGVYKKSIDLMAKTDTNFSGVPDEYIKVLSKHALREEEMSEEFLAKAMKRESRKISPYLAVMKSYHTNFHHFYKDLCFDTTPLIESLARELFIFEMFLDKTRKFYTPQAGTGHQDFDLPFNAKFAKLCVETVKEDKKSWDKYCR